MKPTTQTVESFLETKRQRLGEAEEQRQEELERNREQENQRLVRELCARVNELSREHATIAPDEEIKLPHSDWRILKHDDALDAHIEVRLARRKGQGIDFLGGGEDGDPTTATRVDLRLRSNEIVSDEDNGVVWFSLHGIYDYHNGSNNFVTPYSQKDWEQAVSLVAEIENAFSSTPES